MTGIYLIAGMVALYIILSIAQRRVRASAVKLLTRDFRKLRAAMVSELPRKPASADHPTLVRLSAHYDALTRELATLGFRVLGDFEEFQVDGTPIGIARWIADAEGTSSGWFAALETKKGVERAAVLFTEYTPARYLMSNWGGFAASLTRPSTIERTHLDNKVPLTNMVVAHRNARAQRGSAAATAVTNLDEAVALMERARQHGNEWRARVPAHELLDHDLRAILGKHYDEYAPGIVAAMNEA